MPEWWSTMDPKSPKLLDDIADACGFIVEITSNRTEAQYASDRLRSQSVERNFEILGEALRCLERTDDPTTAARISGYRAVIGLQNRLVHGYIDIDDVRVWEIDRHYLPVLRREVLVSLAEADRG